MIPTKNIGCKISKKNLEFYNSLLKEQLNRVTIFDSTRSMTTTMFQLQSVFMLYMIVKFNIENCFENYMLQWFPRHL
jgi:hypothetical protein